MVYVFLVFSPSREYPLNIAPADQFIFIWNKSKLFSYILQRKTRVFLFVVTFVRLLKNSHRKIRTHPNNRELPFLENHRYRKILNIFVCPSIFLYYNGNNDVYSTYSNSGLYRNKNSQTKYGFYQSMCLINSESNKWFKYKKIFVLVLF